MILLPVFSLPFYSYMMSVIKFSMCMPVCGFQNSPFGFPFFRHPLWCLYLCLPAPNVYLYLKVQKCHIFLGSELRFQVTLLLSLTKSSARATIAHNCLVNARMFTVNLVVKIAHFNRASCISFFIYNK